MNCPRKYAEVATYRIRLAYLDESSDSLTFTDVLLTQKEILTLFLQLHGNAKYGTTTVVDEGTAHEVRAEKPFWLHAQKP